MSEAVAERDEGPHESGGEPGWSERLSFSFFDEAAEIGGVARVEFRPGRESGGADGNLTLFVPGGALATVLTREKLWSLGTWNVGRLHLEQTTPMQRWSIRCKDVALVFPSAGAAGLPKVGERHGAAAQVDMDVSFQSWMSPSGSVERKTDVDDQKFVRTISTGHFEQAGACVGTVRLGGRTIEVAGAGVRSKSWGTRDQTANHDEKWFAVSFDPELAFAVRAVALGGLEMRSGWVLRDGVVRSVARVRVEADYEGRAMTSARLMIADDAGETYEIDADILSAAPMKEGAARVTLAMARFRTKDRQALGLVELVG